jgi:prolyl oligopeptidase
MRTLGALTLCLALGTSCGSTTTMPPRIDPPNPPAQPEPRWPETRREAVTDTIHGAVVADPYRWLERADDPEVQRWIAAQDEYARAELAGVAGLDEIKERLRSLFYYDSIEPPVHRSGRYFTARRHADKEKTIVYSKLGEDGKDEVLLDPNTWADGSALGLWVPSPDGTRVAYKVRSNNADEAVMHVIDVTTGKNLPDVIPGVRYSSPAWSPDGKGFYYTWVPPADAVPRAERPGHAELRYHRIGDDPAKDSTEFPATGDPGTFVIGSISHDGRWLIVQIDHGWSSSDIHVKDLRATGKKKPSQKQNPAWRTLVAGVDATFSVIAWRDRFYVYTNADAPRFRVMRVDPGRLERAAWEEIVPERADAALQRVEIVGEKLALTYLRDAASETEIRDLDGTLVRKLALPPLGTSDGIIGNPDHDIGYFSYTSFTEPSVIFRTSIASGDVSEVARVSLPVDTSQYVTEQVWFPSKDGTRISMFLIHRKGVEKTGNNPTLLFGYGGFGRAITPEFSFARPVMLDAGGVYALPNLRGGGEYGDDWHRAGAGVNKQRAIDDLIAAARYLVDTGWTSPDHLGALGASNGGLVVAAAMTQTPELFRAAVCAVPLTDMVRYHLSGGGPGWASEYGASTDPEQFAALYAYSPYHRVKAGVAYPALLLLSADSDDRVDPMHARKYAAAVQAATSSGRPVLLRIQSRAGHRGSDLVKDQIEETAASIAFLIAELR